MNDTKVDVFIPCLYKDFNKLKFAINGLITHFTELNDIYVTMPDKQHLEDFELLGHAVKFYNDFDILPEVDLSKCRFRPNWIFQQLLKLFQRVTTTKYVLIIDAGLVIVDKFSVFKDGKPVKFIGPYQNFQPYFNFFDKMTKGDLKRFVDKSFIADCGLFCNNIIDEIVQKYGFTKQSFIDFTLMNSTWRGDPKTGCFISEYELFGNYTEKYYQDAFIHDELRVEFNDRLQKSQHMQLWTDKEIIEKIKSIDKTKFNVLKVHSGCCATDIFYAHNERHEK